MYCPKCGAFLEKIGQQFCANCGNPTNQVPINSGKSIPVTNPNFVSPPLYPSNSPLAVIGLAMSIFCCSPLGIILSILGLNQITKNPQQYKGKGFAISGVILGVVGLVIGFFYYFYYLSQFTF